MRSVRGEHTLTNSACILCSIDRSPSEINSMFILQFKLILDHAAYVAATRRGNRASSKTIQITLQGRHDENRRESDRAGRASGPFRSHPAALPRKLDLDRAPAPAPTRRHQGRV